MLYNKYRKFVVSVLFIFFLLCAVTFAQEIKNLSVLTPEGTRNVPVYLRESTLYVSLKHLAEALSINYFQNDHTIKIELKFDNYLFKATGKNPFLVLTDRIDGTQKIYQLPTSTYVFDSRVFAPLKYILEPLQISYGKELKFNPPSQLVIGKVITETDPMKVPDEKLPPISFFNISGFSIDERANGTLIKINSNKRIPSYVSSFKDDVLTFVFRQVNVDTTKVNFSEGRGLIKKIIARNVGPDAEIRLTLGKEYTANEVMNVENSNDVLITLHNKIFSRSNTVDKMKDKWNFDVVVIDPGHGGKDPGAIGINGVKEKDINLAVALKLGKMIEDNMKDVKVVYTRKTDVFLDLYKRGRIANENNGKLFISLHCNSTKKRPTDATGFEVYLLRPGRTKEAIAIAETENSVIKLEENPDRYEKLTDENFILVSMAHAAYMRYSEKFSELLHKEFDRHKELKSRGVKQAGFYVLVGASMPSVLIETGFLTNPRDAKHLASKEGQQKFAEYTFNAIKKYKEHYELMMQSE
jgi:N-acetylmuramoyl-L-alanine amidase